MTTGEKVEAAGKKKEEGNALFKTGKYAKASKRYEKVTVVCRYIIIFHPHLQTMSVRHFFLH